MIGMKLKNSDVKQIQIHYCDGTTDVFNTSENINEIVKRIKVYEPHKQLHEKRVNEITKITRLNRDLAEINKEHIESLNKWLHEYNKELNFLHEIKSDDIDKTRLLKGKIKGVEVSLASFEGTMCKHGLGKEFYEVLEKVEGAE